MHTLLTTVNGQPFEFTFTTDTTESDIQHLSVNQIIRLEQHIRWLMDAENPESTTYEKWLGFWNRIHNVIIAKDIDY